MKKKRLSVRIDGVWYRVSHGKLHKISRPAPKRYAASPQISVESSVDDNIKTHSSMSSAFKEPRYNKPTKSSSFFNDFSTEAADGGLCPFVGGRPQAEPFHELGDSEHAYDSSDESCMSTATSAKKSLVIKIRISKVNGL